MSGRRVVRFCGGPQDFRDLARPGSPPAGSALEVWQAAVTPETAGHCASLLSDAERARAARLRTAAGERFTVGRGLLRSLLAGRLRTDPRSVPLRARCPTCGAPDHGPVRLVGAGVDWRLSLSHSRGLCAAAVGYGGTPVGVDVEYAGRHTELPALEARIFATARRLPAQLPAEHRRAAVLTAWTCAEAYAKASGTGLGVALGRIGARLGADGRLRAGAAGPSGWYVRPYPAALPGYAAAVASPSLTRRRARPARRGRTGESRWEGSSSAAHA